MSALLCSSALRAKHAAASFGGSLRRTVCRDGPGALSRSGEDEHPGSNSNAMAVSRRMEVLDMARARAVPELAGARKQSVRFASRTRARALRGGQARVRRRRFVA